MNSTGMLQIQREEGRKLYNMPEEVAKEIHLLRR